MLMAGTLLFVVTASMSSGELGICPGNADCRLTNSSQSPVPLGLSRLYHFVQQTAEEDMGAVQMGD